MKYSIFYNGISTDKGGIYAIECLPGGTVFVGSAKCFIKKWNKHFSALTNNQHRNKELQNDWNYYGAESFVFYAIEEGNPKILEKYYLNCMKEKDGVRFDDETRKKISERRKRFFRGEKGPKERKRLAGMMEGINQRKKAKASRHTIIGTAA